MKQIVLILLCLGVASAQTTGGQIFEKRCGGCHALDQNHEGPALAGVYGRAAGSVASFQYSAALRKAGIVWSREKLDQWLTDPDKLVPDNDMSYPVANPDERRAILDYLMEVSRRLANSKR